MAKDILIERSEILQSFNAEEISQLVKDQMKNLFTEMNGIPIDYLKPIYYNYQQMKDMEMDEDLRRTLNEDYITTVKIFIAEIEEAFGFKIDENYIENNVVDLPSLALVLYSFFVLELSNNIEDSLHRAIKMDADNLYDLFEERKNKKDGSTAIYSKCGDPKLALLMANIYDVSVQVMTEMTEEEFLKYLPEGYLPGDVVRKLYEEGKLMGDFMEVIRENFIKSSFLRSMICFNIESTYRKNK